MLHLSFFLLKEVIPPPKKKGVDLSISPWEKKKKNNNTPNSSSLDLWHLAGAGSGRPGDEADSYSLGLLGQ